MTPRSLGVLFRNTAERFPSKTAFLYKENGKYTPISWREALGRVRALASALVSRGILSGDRVAILSENRPEWALLDLACQTIGAVSVPIYTTLAAAEIQYILNDCGAKLLVVSAKSLFEKIPPIQKSCGSLKGIVAMDPAIMIQANGLGIPIHRFADMEKEPVNPEISKRAEAVDGDQIASLIYTSGTTGFPKGVMLTHLNFISNVLFCKDAFPMSPKDRHLSFLPLSHVFERTVGHYLMVFIGATIAYAESMDTVPQNMLEARPTFLLGVPRFYEKVQNRALEALEKAGASKKKLFALAKTIGAKRRSKNLPLNFLENLQYGLLRLLVYKKFNARLGGRVRFCVSGGAALPKEIGEFFHDLGLTICEGYGLTETAPVICANRVKRFKFGSIGFALNGVEVKLTQEGEIATKSACVMKGYYHKPDETAAVMKEGWFYTGDLGRMDEEGFLFITGRKKEIIVTSGGKKVSPRPIEELLEKDAYILRAVLCGEAKRFITALIVPQKERLMEYANDHKIAYADYAELLKTEKIHQFLDGRVQNLMADFAPYERVKYFTLLENDFSQSAGELTPTLKVKREVVFSRYQNCIEALYAVDKPG